MEIIGEKRRDHLFLPKQDLVVHSIRIEERKRVDVSLEDLSCNFEKFKNITRAQISRNALAFIRFSYLFIHE